MVRVVERRLMIGMNVGVWEMWFLVREGTVRIWELGLSVELVAVSPNPQPIPTLLILRLTPKQPPPQPHRLINLNLSRWIHPKLIRSNNQSRTTTSSIALIITSPTPMFNLKILYKIL